MDEAREELKPEAARVSGRYVLGERLGEGAFAVTYRAQDTLLDRTVALKLLRPQYATEASLAARFARESEAAASVSHPNVVAVYDHGAHEDTLFIAMGYVPGQTLKHLLIERRRLAPPDAVALARQMLRGLGAIHAAGIVHRDVKPQNVLVGDDGVARVADFGVALCAADTTLTTDGTTVGTAAYMAPEQARGEPVGPAADLYAVGAVLYELLTGRPPFTAETTLALLLAHQEREPVAPREVAPDAGIPPALEAVVLRLLAKDQAARYVDAAAAEAALEAALAEPEVATPPAPVSPNAVTAPLPAPNQAAAGTWRARRLRSAWRPAIRSAQLRPGWLGSLLVPGLVLVLIGGAVAVDRLEGGRAPAFEAAVGAPPATPSATVLVVPTATTPPTAPPTSTPTSSPPTPTAEVPANVTAPTRAALPTPPAASQGPAVAIQVGADQAATAPAGKAQGSRDRSQAEERRGAERDEEADKRNKEEQKRADEQAREAQRREEERAKGAEKQDGGESKRKGKKD